MTNETNNVQAALDAGRALSTPFDVVHQQSVVVIPNSYHTEALEKVIEPYLQMPRRIKAKVRLAEVASFIAYVEAFMTEATRIFATVPTDNKAPSFEAIVDYHQDPTHADWCEHRATYAPAFTEEWKRIAGKDRQHMDQVGLAEFIEENLILIFSPPAAELLELVQTLEGKNSISCNTVVRLTNGKTRILYEEDVSLKGSISTQQGQVEFPSALVFVVAPFAGGPAYKINARLKYRIPNRKLDFWFELIDVHLIIKDAVKAVVDKIEDDLKIKALMGSI